MNEFQKYQETHRDDPAYAILGVQGAGTNLVSRLMRTMFDFSIVRDRCLIFDQAYDLTGNCTPATVRAKFNSTYNWLFPGQFRKRFLGKHYHHRNGPFEGIAEAFNAETIKTPADFAHFFYDYHAFTDGAAHKGLKSDDLWERMDRIDSLLPNRRYILLVRDFRDNALSIMNKDFGPKDIFAASEYVAHRFNIYRDAIDRHTEPSLTVKYETLLTNPREFVTEFTKSFGLDPVQDWEQRLDEFPIRTNNFNKWQQLPQETLAVCETVLKDQLTAFDYELGTSADVRLSPSQQTARRIKDRIIRIPQRVGVTLSKIVSP